MYASFNHASAAFRKDGRGNQLFGLDEAFNDKNIRKTFESVQQGAEYKRSSGNTFKLCFGSTLCQAETSRDLTNALETL